ncbi:hypothetical protein AAMO2058_000487300 [Amorphochlora amoebiformis]
MAGCQLTRSQVLKLGYATILFAAVGYVIACWSAAAYFEGSNDKETSRFKFLAVWTSIMVLLSSVFMTYTLLFQAGDTNNPAAEAYIGASLAMLFMMCNSSIISMVQWGDPGIGEGSHASYQAVTAMSAIYAVFSFFQLLLLFIWHGPCATKQSPEIGTA